VYINKNFDETLNPGVVVYLQSQLFGRLRQKDHMSPGVQDKPGQQAFETEACLKKIKVIPGEVENSEYMRNLKLRIQFCHVSAR
jgi:hypothetical protein